MLRRICKKELFRLVEIKPTSCHCSLNSVDKIYVITHFFNFEKSPEYISYEMWKILSLQSAELFNFYYFLLKSPRDPRSEIRTGHMKMREDFWITVQEHSNSFWIGWQYCFKKTYGKHWLENVCQQGYICST